MSEHLSDEQWAAVVLNEIDETAAKHLAVCATCRENIESFRAAAGAAQARVRRVLERPEAFWRRQHQSISARVERRNFFGPWKRLVWVAASIILIVLSSALLSRNGAPPVQTAAQTDSDDALLLSVRQSIQSDLPQALKPASLLTEEMYRAEQAGRTP